MIQTSIGLLTLCPRELWSTEKNSASVTAVKSSQGEKANNGKGIK